MSFFSPLEPGSYDIAVFDMPWRFEVRSKKGIAKSPEAKYKTMTLDEISRLPAADLLKPTGVAVFWLTWPLIRKQTALIEEAFGLTVLTGGAWAKRTRTGKLRVGTGYILRSVCEPFVVAARKGHKLRGKSAVNLVETMEDLALDGLAREHSRKPSEMYALLESMTPGWRRADVFAIDVRSEWEGFGDELGKRR